MLVIVFAVCAALVLLVPVLAVWADERPDNGVEHHQQDQPRGEDEPDLKMASAA